MTADVFRWLMLGAVGIVIVLLYHLTSRVEAILDRSSSVEDFLEAILDRLRPDDEVGELEDELVERALRPGRQERQNSKRKEP